MIGRRDLRKGDAQPEETPQGFDSYDLRLGDVMRGERATLGKSLLDVQRELKIKAAYISAIENCDPSGFETPGFVAGYVRSYARYLGLDPDWAYTTFCRESDFQIVDGLASKGGYKPVAKRKAPAEKGKRDTNDLFANPNTPFVPRNQAVFSGVEPGAVGSILVLLSLVAAIGYGGWFVLQEVQKVQFAPVEQSPGLVSEVDPLAESPIDVAEIGAAPGFTPPSAEALDRLYRPQALDVPVLEARDGPIAAVDPANFGVLAPMTLPVEAPVAVAEAANQADAIEDALIKVVEDEAPEVVMFAVRPAWVRVRAADGTVLFEKILDAGEEYVLPTTEEAPRLRAGNSGSVYFRVNGETYGPAGPGTSVAKQVALSSEALKEAYQVADLEQDRDLARIVAELAAAPVTPAAPASE
ncbi:helix-turn-helix domain-containing protein [Pseudoruegeria sp. SHC-113]|uniref:helix-turn-helix domain-containing protein n=1 Tax=Pseudoruegeria sp. SHC-113 TaxID=2855439 RepID=UPI0021BA84DC|nr:helix-turn-helix domain-containing protein [Pseudoruegeria sp. SHC-113]MCT8160296.1 helix-turn-helix domain-containing protein [Pseudoruegeria sp. SHC-113]